MNAENRSERELQLRDLLVTFGQTRGLGFDFHTSLRYAQSVASFEAMNRATAATDNSQS